MKIADVRARAFAMPLNNYNPSYPPGPYRFYDREYFVIEYLTDPQALRAAVPETKFPAPSSSSNSFACRIRQALANSPNAAR
jgi:acetoacetate decarboxylase